MYKVSHMTSLHISSRARTRVFSTYTHRKGQGICEGKFLASCCECACVCVYMSNFIKSRSEKGKQGYNFCFSCSFLFFTFFFESLNQDIYNKFYSREQKSFDIKWNKMGNVKTIKEGPLIQSNELCMRKKEEKLYYYGIFFVIKKMNIKHFFSFFLFIHDKYTKKKEPDLSCEERCTTGSHTTCPDAHIIRGFMWRQPIIITCEWLLVYVRTCVCLYDVYERGMYATLLRHHS